MSATDPLPYTISDTVTLSEELREEGRIDGQVKLYNIDKEDEFESDATKFFKRTVLTQGLHETLTILRDSLNGDDPRKTHILYGPYGSGKSHQMVALYHCFNAPDEAAKWSAGKIGGLSDALPEDTKTISVSMQYENNDYIYLWEPFFNALGYDHDSFDTGGYPDIQTIEDAVGDQSVAFIVDELEDWYDTLDDEHESANRAFLQALLEATALESLDLHTIVSVLRKGSKVHNILNREDAVEVNMSSKVSKRDVLLHRLVEDVDDEKAREIVNGYVDAYEKSDYVELPNNLREDMREAYPLHPVLIDAMEARYYGTDDDNQNARGMIYFFSDLLLELQEEVDLITAGDIDAIRFEDDLSKINYDRPQACATDINDRVPSEIPYGRRVLNTILLYSLNEGPGEGAEVSDIIMGAYRTNDRISDIYINLEQLHGVAWHLHKLNGKYAIRDKRNPSALIRNAASDVSETAAKGEIADIVKEIFGPGSYPVGFRSDDIRDIPDTKQVKVVIKRDTWTEEEMRTVVMNDGRGRSWRNTFVFVEPKEGEAIESGTRYIDKARYVEGARQVLASNGLDEDIKSVIQGMKDREEKELRKELRSAFGLVLDSDNLFDNFGKATKMALDVFVIDGNSHSAKDIANAASADKFDLQEPAWEILQDLFDRRGEATLEEVWEEFLRKPEYPVPGSVGAVIDAAKEILPQKPVVTHTDEDGFDDSFEKLTPGTVVRSIDGIENWTTDDLMEDLRDELSSEPREVILRNYLKQLLKRTDVRIDGEEKDALLMASGRLESEDRYVLLENNEYLDKPNLNATLRDISDATIIGAAEVREHVNDAIASSGKANMEHILTNIRNDPAVYLPAIDTEPVFRKVVNDCLAEHHLLEAGRRYHAKLGDRDPDEVTLVPTVSAKVAKEIDSYVSDLDPDTNFTVASVRNRFGSDVTEAAVQTYLLQNLGKDQEPKYVIGTNGSDDPTDWRNGYPFTTPKSGTIEVRTFKYIGDSGTDLRAKWRKGHYTGTVDYGNVRYVLQGSEGVPDELQETIGVESTYIDLTLESGEPHEAVSKLFDKIPKNAIDIKIEIGIAEE